MEYKDILNIRTVNTLKVCSKLLILLDERRNLAIECEYEVSNSVIARQNNVIDKYTVKIEEYNKQIRELLNLK